MRSLIISFTCVAACLSAAATPASAHPHVLITATAELVLAPGDVVTAIREIWTFDEMYTAFAITGFGSSAQDPGAEGLHEVAKQNIADLAEVDYFTRLETGKQKAAFEKPIQYSAKLLKTKDDVERLQLQFLLPLKKPLEMGKEAVLRIYDPSYFTAFSFAPGDSVRLIGAARCSIAHSKPQALAAIDQMALTESFFTNLLPGSDFGVKMAEAVRIGCS